MQKERAFSLNTVQLKIIACVAMLIDHVNTYLSHEIYRAIGTSIAYIGTQISFAWMFAIGRIAFPVYCFQIAEGCRYTSNIKKYF